jgi:hypothetical protein
MAPDTPERIHVRICSAQPNNEEVFLILASQDREVLGAASSHRLNH